MPPLASPSPALLLQVRQTIIEDLGQPPEALFRDFAQTPIASASLAQVHEATDHDGRRLAVKVGIPCFCCHRC